MGDVIDFHGLDPKIAAERGDLLRRVDGVVSCPPRRWRRTRRRVTETGRRA